jgi:hypothetical protein
MDIEAYRRTSIFRLFIKITNYFSMMSELASVLIAGKMEIRLLQQNG